MMKHLRWIAFSTKTNRHLVFLSAAFVCALVIFQAILCLCRRDETWKNVPGSKPNFASDRRKVPEKSLFSEEHSSQNFDEKTNVSEGRHLSSYDEPSALPCSALLERYTDIKNTIQFDPVRFAVKEAEKNPYLVAELMNVMSPTILSSAKFFHEEIIPSNAPEVIRQRMAAIDILTSLAVEHTTSHAGKEAVEALLKLCRNPVTAEELAKRRVLYAEKLEILDAMRRIHLLTKEDLILLEDDPVMLRLIEDFFY